MQHTALGRRFGTHCYQAGSAAIVCVLFPFPLAKLLSLSRERGQLIVSACDGDGDAARRRVDKLTTLPLNGVCVCVAEEEGLACRKCPGYGDAIAGSLSHCVSRETVVVPCAFEAPIIPADADEDDDDEDGEEAYCSVLSALSCSVKASHYHAGYGGMV